MRTQDGEELIFSPMQYGLYACSPDQAQQMAMVTMVTDLEAMYTPRQKQTEQEAQRIQSIIMCPATRECRWVVDHHLIPNCPVSGQDIFAVEKLYGLNLGNLKGKTVACPGKNTNQSVNPVPDNILSIHGNMMLCMDIMHVNGVTFLITVLKHTNFGTIEYIAD